MISACSPFWRFRKLLRYSSASCASDRRGLSSTTRDYLLDVRPGHAPAGYYEFYYQGELEGDDEDDYDAIGGLYFEDPTHELFDFISGLEGLDEDSGWLGA